MMHVLLSEELPLHEPVVTCGCSPTTRPGEAVAVHHHISDKPIFGQAVMVEDRDYERYEELRDARAAFTPTP